jgi:hypothetical protein
MYFNPQAPKGKYNIKVKYFGTDKETLTHKTVQLKTVSEKESVMVIGVE